DPNNATAFITDVAFEGAGNFTGTMTPITVSVPEPSTWTTLLIGFAGLGFAAYRKGRVGRMAGGTGHFPPLHQLARVDGTAVFRAAGTAPRRREVDARIPAG